MGRWCYTGIRTSAMGVARLAGWQPAAHATPTLRHEITHAANPVSQMTHLHFRLATYLKHHIEGCLFLRVNMDFHVQLILKKVFKIFQGLKKFISILLILKIYMICNKCHTSMISKISLTLLGLEFSFLLCSQPTKLRLSSHLSHSWESVESVPFWGAFYESALSHALQECVCWEGTLV